MVGRLVGFNAAIIHFTGLKPDGAPEYDAPNEVESPNCTTPAATAPEVDEHANMPEVMSGGAADNAADNADDCAVPAPTDPEVDEHAGMPELVSDDREIEATDYWSIRHISGVHPCDSMQVRPLVVPPTTQHKSAAEYTAAFNATNYSRQSLILSLTGLSRNHDGDDGAPEEEEEKKRALASSNCITPAATAPEVDEHANMPEVMSGGAADNAADNADEYAVPDAFNAEDAAFVNGAIVHFTGLRPDGAPEYAAFVNAAIVHFTGLRPDGAPEYDAPNEVESPIFDQDAPRVDRPIGRVVFSGDHGAHFVSTGREVDNDEASDY